MNLFRAILTGRLYLVCLSSLILFSGYGAMALDTTYVKKYKSDFTLRLGFKQEELGLIFNPERGFNFDGLRYYPNIGQQAGVGIAIKNIGANIFFNLPGTVDDEQFYGQTKYTDISFNITTRYLLLNPFFKRFKGFYLDETGTYYPGWNTDSAMLSRPDLSYTTAGMYTYVVIGGDQFSIKSALVQTQKQFKSAGAFFIKFTAAYDKISSDSSLVPRSIRPTYGTSQFFSRAEVVKGGMGLGFGYNFIIGHIYMMPSAIFSPLLQVKRFHNEALPRYSMRFAMVSDYKLALGYNTDHFFAGINSGLLFDKFSVGPGLFRMINWNILGFVGVRF